MSFPSDVLLNAAADLDRAADSLTHTGPDEYAQDAINILRRHAEAIRVANRNLSMEMAA